MTSMLERSARIVDGTDAAPIGLKVTAEAAPVEEVAVAAPAADAAAAPAADAEKKDA